MLKGQCQKLLINRKCQKRLMFLQGDNREALSPSISGGSLSQWVHIPPPLTPIHSHSYLIQNRIPVDFLSQNIRCLGDWIFILGRDFVYGMKTRLEFLKTIILKLQKIRVCKKKCDFGLKQCGFQNEFNSH